jgi:hypothetical protein
MRNVKMSRNHTFGGWLCSKLARCIWSEFRLNYKVLLMLKNFTKIKIWN